MDLQPTEEQLELRSIVDELLAQRASSQQVRAMLTAEAPYDAALWSVLCEQIGAAGLAIPEAYGGAGFGARETQVVLEALGRTLVPLPYLGSVAIAVPAILASDNADATGDTLPQLAAGEELAALAWAAPDGRWAPEQVAVTAEQDAAEPGRWRLRGAVGYVLDGDTARVLITIAQTPAGPALFHVPATESVTRTHTPTLDPTLWLARLEFRDAPATLLSDDPAAIATTHTHALTAVAATQVGTASRALHDTVTYLQQRVQFGRQLGSYQALKHRIAQMYVALETARTTATAAATALADDDAAAPRLARLAKATASDTLRLLASEMIQLHGGIAITWEHDSHLVFKRAHATGLLFGTAATLRAA